MAYGDSIGLGNITENWLFEFGFYNGDAQGNGDGGFSAVTQADGSANQVKVAITNANATSIDVDDATVFVVGDFIKIDSEILKVTAITDSDTLAVTRAQLGTTKATHSLDAQIYWNNFFPMAFSDVINNTLYYKGVILNKPSIRESINLANSTAKTGNVNITIPDFDYEGNPVSKELFGGTRQYINHEVKIHCKINQDDLHLLGSFRLVDIATDGEKIKLSLTAHRPWDFLSIPQQKSPKNNYFPIAYGDYTKNSSTRASQDFCDSVALYPCPVEARSSSYIKGLQPQQLSSDARLHIFEEELDAFIPLTKSDNTFRDTAVTDGDGFSTIIEKDLFRGFITKGFEERGSSSNEFGNPASAVASQNTAVTSSSFASASVATGADERTGAFEDSKDLFLDCPAIVGTVTEAKSVFFVERTTAVTAGSPQGTATINDLSGSSIFDIHNFHSESEGTESATLTNEVTLSIVNGQLPTNYGLKAKINIVTGSYTGVSSTVKVFDARLKVKANLDFANNKEASTNTINGIKFLYCGADGLPASWDSDPIDEIHDAHRDMLIRYAGLSTDDPVGWSDLDSSKDWKIRYWRTKPESLEKVLEKLQYEGGFIYLPTSNKYIYIKDSYGTTAASNILSKADISKINVKMTSFSELLTKMDVNYQKHPAQSRYILTQNCSNSASRVKFNIKSAENIKSVDLDAYVSPTIPASPSSNPNDDFYSYYDNIFGSIKLIVSCDIVNPAFYSLEVGDVIEFDENNMYPPTPMGHNSGTWDGLKMMITSTNRTLGRMGITAREI